MNSSNALRAVAAAQANGQAAEKLACSTTKCPIDIGTDGCHACGMNRKTDKRGLREPSPARLLAGLREYRLTRYRKHVALRDALHNGGFVVRSLERLVGQPVYEGRCDRGVPLPFKTPAYYQNKLLEALKAAGINPEGDEVYVSMTPCYVHFSFVHLWGASGVMTDICKPGRRRKWAFKSSWTAKEQLTFPA